MVVQPTSVDFWRLRERFKLNIAVQRLSVSGKGIWIGHTSHWHYFWGRVYIFLGWLLGLARAVTAAVRDSLPPLSLNGCQCEKCTYSVFPPAFPGLGLSGSLSLPPYWEPLTDH